MCMRTVGVGVATSKTNPSDLWETGKASPIHLQRDSEGIPAPQSKWEFW